MRKRSKQVRAFAPGLSGGVGVVASTQVDALNAESDSFSARLVLTNPSGGISSPLRFIALCVRLVSDVARNDVHVVHLHVSKGGSTVRKVALGLVCECVRVPYIAQVHSGSYPDFLRSLPKPAAWLVSRFFQHASLTVVLGPVWADALVKQVGIRRERIVVIPNAASDFGGHDSEKRAQTILFLGEVSKRKGVLDLVRAFATLDDAAAGWRLLIAGEGPDMEEVERLGDQLDCRDQISLLGWVGRDEVDQLLASSAIFVLPSYSEAMSISLLEAMSAGLACISTSVGTHREVLQDGKAGWLFAPGEIEDLAGCLSEAMTSHAERDRRGVNARIAFVDRYTSSAVMRELESAYESVL